MVLGRFHPSFMNRSPKKPVGGPSRPMAQEGHPPPLSDGAVANWQGADMGDTAAYNSDDAETNVGYACMRFAAATVRTVDVFMFVLSPASFEVLAKVGIGRGRVCGMAAWVNL